MAGTTLADAIEGAEVYDADVIRPRDNPICPNNSLAVLRGNLCPDGAVIKPAAAEARLLKHRHGSAIVL
ncbi:MAG: dihydroxy-acid dehydratase [Planctomycetaceae bacterium]